MPVPRLARFVGAHLVEGGLVRGLVALYRNLRRHASHREGAAAVAGLDQLQRVSGEEGLIHGHRRPVRSEPLARAAEALYVGEDIIPPTAIQADDVLPQR